MKTVVIVDNNTEILRQVEDSLNKVEGINVIGTAEDGEKGILMPFGPLLTPDPLRTWQIFPPPALHRRERQDTFLSEL